MDEQLLRQVMKMTNNPIRNYVTPGLTSSLVGGGEFGKVRLFSCDRDTRDWITPHSHRFDFTCLVLEGSVVNIIYEKSGWNNGTSNLFCVGTLTAGVGFGDYSFEPGTGADWYEEARTEYKAGDLYSMTAKEIHSIQFSRGARVLFFEGPELSRTSWVLEPFSDKARVPTFEARPWMFQR